MKKKPQKITTFLWFDDQAETAAKFYVSIFKNSRVTGVARYGASSAAASGQRAGSVMTVAFELEGQAFTALNGGPQFKFSPAVSFVVNCATQKELDALWKKLSSGGAEGPCGWLTDKFGVFWQLVPAELAPMMTGKDSAAAERAMAAIMTMKKLDAAAIRRAYAGDAAPTRHAAGADAQHVASNRSA
jgi:predicted 3-demethylubiquinone-9 3-methyltransferase (glyoxalase superfamily)